MPKLVAKNSGSVNTNILELLKTGGIIKAQSGTKVDENKLSVSELYKLKTGKDWSTAKREGLTNGSYEQNIALRKKLLSGELGAPADFSKPRANVITSTQDAYKQQTTYDEGPLGVSKVQELPEISFNSAFVRARNELGSGKEFIYNGNRYTTNTKEDNINTTNTTNTTNASQVNAVSQPQPSTLSTPNLQLNSKFITPNLQLNSKFITEKGSSVNPNNINPGSDTNASSTLNTAKPDTTSQPHTSQKVQRGSIEWANTPEGKKEMEKLSMEWEREQGRRRSGETTSTFDVTDYVLGVGLPKLGFQVAKEATSILLSISAKQTAKQVVKQEVKQVAKQTAKQGVNMTKEQVKKQTQKFIKKRAVVNPTSYKASYIVKKAAK